MWMLIHVLQDLKCRPINEVNVVVLTVTLVADAIMANILLVARDIINATLCPICQSFPCCDSFLR